MDTRADEEQRNVSQLFLPECRWCEYRHPPEAACEDVCRYEHGDEYRTRTRSILSSASARRTPCTQCGNTHPTWAPHGPRPEIDHTVQSEPQQQFSFGSAKQQPPHRTPLVFGSTEPQQQGFSFVSKPAKPEGYDDLLQSFMQMYEPEKAERLTALAYPEYTGIKLSSGPFSAIAQQQQRYPGFGVAAQQQPQQQSFGQSAFGMAAQQQPQQQSFGFVSSTARQQSTFGTVAPQQPFGQMFGTTVQHSQPAFGMAAQQQPFGSTSGVATLQQQPYAPIYGGQAEGRGYAQTTSLQPVPYGYGSSSHANAWQTPEPRRGEDGKVLSQDELIAESKRLFP